MVHLAGPPRPRHANPGRPYTDLGVSKTPSLTREQAVALLAAADAAAAPQAARNAAIIAIYLCLQTAITIAPGTGARYRQDLPYGSPAWHARYATLRNTIEGLNGLVKDTAHEALAAPARRRVRGIAACSLFTALLLMAASIPKIRTWRALTTSDQAGITRRARRRRTSLRDYLPDG